VIINSYINNRYIYELQPWMIVKQRILHLYKNIKDTVKYLNSCEAIFKELYSSDIGHLKLSIENVFNTLLMFQTFSCYSFDKSLITEILLTCLNQIVISSINYLTNNNTEIFWEQSKQIMIEKLVE
jgi:hypothetical protein